MPELPEVESIRRGLESVLLGQKILQTTINKPKLVSGSGNKRVVSPQKTLDFVQKTAKRKITQVGRRNKNLILELDDNSAIVIHLKMTGQLVYKPNSASQKMVLGGHPIELSEKQIPNKHTHIIFELEKGNLFYNDVRQFGYLLYFEDKNGLDFQAHFQDLGLEPLSKEFTLKYFEESLAKTKSILKKVLLDQKIVVGLGNIYADEVCFRAKVLPFRQALTLSKAEVKKLYEAIVEILPLAILEGGSSVANYLLADGSRGNFARFHQVYGKSGKPCLVCSQILQSQKINGRTTVYCLHCQK
jgi:formamidopyrimidine-DNA glycosylase